MPDWTKSMQQTFEYYIVNPETWKDVKKITFVKNSSIDRDLESETLGSMSINIDENIGETYLRVYLITVQNGVTERHPLGTFLVQTPSMNFDGKTKMYSADAYTPLLELKEKHPSIGHFEEEGCNIMERVYMLARENMRAPVIKPNSDETLQNDFVSDPDENLLEFLSSFMANAKHIFELDAMGNVYFVPKQETAALQPVWTFDDGNSSILYPDIDINQDLYGIPNVVEVICSGSGKVFHYIAENNDSNSPVSIANRGRRIVYRDTNPSIIGAATDEKVKEYAELLLKELSTIERRITYTHGYCPVKIGDCVRLNYDKAGLVNVKARVVSQNISCVPGCPVSETAVYTSKLYGGNAYVPEQ